MSNIDEGLFAPIPMTFPEITSPIPTLPLGGGRGWDWTTWLAIGCVILVAIIIIVMVYWKITSKKATKDKLDPGPPEQSSISVSDKTKILDDAIKKLDTEDISTFDLGDDEPFVSDAEPAPTPPLLPEPKSEEEEDTNLDNIFAVDEDEFPDINIEDLMGDNDETS